MKNIIKRSDLEYNMKDGWYCEVKKTLPPGGNKANEGEEIYIAQKGYAIYARGIISEIKRIEKNSLNEFVKYSLQETNVKDDLYWLSKIKRFSLEKDSFKVHILEYKISNTELLESTIPLEKKFLNRPVWYRVEDDYEFKVPEKNTILTKHIPTKVREEVYHRFKIKLKKGEFAVDIDHFVPLKHGGPGNIIENLIPIGPSINRRKSDSIPSKIYDLGNKFGVKIPSQIIIEHDRFYSSKKEKELALKIIEKINDQSIDKIRSDYKLIRDFHFPSLANA